MDTKDIQGNAHGSHGPMCHDCGACDGMHGHHQWKHLVIKIAVALFIFWCGIQFGELKAILHSAYAGYGMMGSQGGSYWNY